MQRTFSDGANRLWRYSSSPFTNTLLVIMGVFFLGEWIFPAAIGWLTALMPLAWLQPWRIFTSPLVPGGILGLLFSGLMLWFTGTSLERSWGTKTFAGFYAALCLAAALAFTGISFLFFKGQPFPSAGVLTGILVGFCVVNPDETINLYGIIPIKTRWIAVGACAIQFFTYGWTNPIVGLMSLAAPGFAVFWVRQGWQYGFGTLLPNVSRHTIKRPDLRLIVPKEPKPKDDRFSPRDLNPLEWFAKRKRRKQFEKLMEDD